VGTGPLRCSGNTPGTPQLFPPTELLSPSAAGDDDDEDVGGDDGDGDEELCIPPCTGRRTWR